MSRRDDAAAAAYLAAVAEARRMRDQLIADARKALSEGRYADAEELAESAARADSAYSAAVCDVL